MNNLRQVHTDESLCGGTYARVLSTRRGGRSRCVVAWEQAEVRVWCQWNYGRGGGHHHAPGCTSTLRRSHTKFRWRLPQPPSSVATSEARTRACDCSRCALTSTSMARRCPASSSSRRSTRTRRTPGVYDQGATPMGSESWDRLDEQPACTRNPIAFHRAALRSGIEQRHRLTPSRSSRTHPPACRTHRRAQRPKPRGGGHPGRAVAAERRMH